MGLWPSAQVWDPQKRWKYLSDVKWKQKPNGWVLENRGILSDKWWVRSDEWWKLSEEWWVMKKRKRKKSKQGLYLRILVVAYPTPIAHHYHNHEDEFLPPNFTVCIFAIIFARFCQCNVRIWRIPNLHNPYGPYSQACAFLNPWVMASLHPKIIVAISC